MKIATILNQTGCQFQIMIKIFSILKAHDFDIQLFFKILGQCTAYF